MRRLNAELERRVRERTAELARAHNDLQQVAYISAHDLQEPVRMVGVYTQKLARRYHATFDAEGRGDMEYIVGEAQRMGAQLNDLLAYLEVEQKGPGIINTNCEEVLRRVLAKAREALAAAGGSVTHDPLPTTAVNPTQLQFVLSHLIDNAMKFHAAAPVRIHVWAEREGSAWRFAVRDNGIGINPEHTDKIFRFFQRLHPRSQHPGTGMGLAICRKIVEQHGGRIWVDSTPGEGSTFYFTLPDSRV